VLFETAGRVDGWNNFGPQIRLWQDLSVSRRIGLYQVLTLNLMSTYRICPARDSFGVSVELRSECPVAR